jgi:hypothetical protein
MKRSGLILGIAIILATNAIALIMAAKNRSGAPLQTIELTERELGLQIMGQENSGVAMRLNWHRQNEDTFLDRAKLEAIGFDCRLPEGAAAKDVSPLPRAAYVALEYEGKAWEQWSQRPESEKRPNQYSPQPSFASRLFPVDVSRSFSELRNRYPDRSKFLIVAAVVRARIQDVGDQKTGTPKPDRIVGFVAAVLPSDINVPLPYAKLLSSLKTPAGQEPRYLVTLQYGSNLEPWVSSVKLK